MNTILNALLHLLKYATEDTQAFSFMHNAPKKLTDALNIACIELGKYLDSIE